MVSLDVIGSLRRKYEALDGELSERGRRLWAGSSEAMVLGYGGVAAVARATGLSESTIRRGRHEVAPGRKASIESGPKGPVRRRGGGRKLLTEHDSDLLAALEALVEPTARGDPMSPLRWTCKSTRRVATELCRQGHVVGHSTVAKLLKEMDYSLQGTRKTKEGTSHPDRNAQFEHIYKQVVDFQKRGQPVVSVDAKKKELVGDFSRGGREYQPKGQPEEVRVHDFVDKELGKAIPYGIYDMTANEAWVSVGTDHDTAQFAVETLRRWWRQMGSQAYPDAKEVLITADGGGSNGSRNRLWKLELQQLADEAQLTMGAFPKYDIPD